MKKVIITNLHREWCKTFLAKHSKWKHVWIFLKKKTLFEEGTQWKLSYEKPVWWSDFMCSLCPMLLPRVHFGNQHTQHHFSDCWLATPMITNIDTEVEHAHVHEDAVRRGGGGGGLLSSCLPLFVSAALLLVRLYIWKHAGRCAGDEDRVCAGCIKDPLRVHVFYASRPSPFFFSAWSRPASCVCAVLSRGCVKSDRRGQEKSGNLAGVLST